MWAQSVALRRSARVQFCIATMKEDFLGVIGSDYVA